MEPTKRDGGDQPTAPPARWPWLAAIATAIFLLLFYWPTGEERAPTTPPVADSSSIQSLVPDRPLPLDECRLQWTPGPEGSSYRLTLATVDSRTLATWQGLDKPQHLIPKGVLLPVKGESFLWRVEVFPPEGDPHLSATFTTRLEDD